jgi:hypothetical protein
MLVESQSHAGVRCRDRFKRNAYPIGQLPRLLGALRGVP